MSEIKYNNNWIKEENKFKKAIIGIKIPEFNLSNVDFVEIKNRQDLNNIVPVLGHAGGCYWIWTNEPINHYFHKNKIPMGFNGGEVIYNGIAKDDIRGRISNHLFSTEHEGRSGISIDIYKHLSSSHHKKACSLSGKVPFILDPIILGPKLSTLKQIKIKTDLLTLTLDSSEITYITSSPLSTFYFRNGINVTESKHKNYEYRIYYIIGLSTLYIEHIEKEWRKANGLPRLCSYSSGR